MPSRRRIIRRQKKSPRRRRSTNPSSAAQSYRGPLRLPLSRLQTQTTTIQLVQVVSANSSSGGVQNVVITLSLASFQEYTNFTAIYDEYRLLSAEAMFVPVSENSDTNSLLLSVGAICLDRDSNAALSTLTSCYLYESCKVHSYNKRVSIIYRMSGSEDAAFASVSSYSPGYFKTYCASLTNSSLYGYYFVRGLFQFRGRL